MNDQTKLLVAIGVLVISLGTLGYQVYARFIAKPEPAEAVADDGGMMNTEEALVEEAAAVEWSPPEGGLQAALVENPFLRPPGASSSRMSSGSGRTPLTVQGTRTGAQPMAIINDRTVQIGESIAGWRLVSVERNRVTLRNSDGETIQRKSVRSR